SVARVVPVDVDTITGSLASVRTGYDAVVVMMAWLLAVDGSGASDRTYAVAVSVLATLGAMVRWAVALAPGKSLPRAKLIPPARSSALPWLDVADTKEAMSAGKPASRWTSGAGFGPRFVTTMV